MLGNGLHMFDNGPHILGNSTFGLMSHLGLLYNMCHLEFVGFSILSHSALCRIWGYVGWYYVVRHYVAFGVMSFSIMSHSALCHIQTCVVWHNVVRIYVVQRNGVRPTVGVSNTSTFLYLLKTAETMTPVFTC